MLFARRQGYPGAEEFPRELRGGFSLFDEPILGNSALDRLANTSYQSVIEGSSYRERLSPHRPLRDAQEGGD